MNGSLCEPQELAGKSPDENVGQRCLLWAQALLGVVPVSWGAGLHRGTAVRSFWDDWERCSAPLPSVVTGRVSGVGCSLVNSPGLFPIVCLGCCAPSAPHDCTTTQTKKQWEMVTPGMPGIVLKALAHVINLLSNPVRYLT